MQRFFKNIFSEILNNLDTHNWFLYLFFIFIFLITISYLLNFFIEKLNSTFKNNFITQILNFVWIPILSYLWLNFIYIILKKNNILKINTDIDAKIPVILFLFCIFLIIYKIITQIEISYLQFYNKKSENRNSLKIWFLFILRIFKIILTLSFIIYLLYSIDINFSTLLIFSGSYLSVIGGLLIVSNILRIFYHKFLGIIVKNGHFWIYVILKSIYSPLQTLFLIEGIYLFYKISVVRWPLSKTFTEIILKGHLISLIALLGWFFFKFTQNFENQLLLGRLTKKIPTKTSAQFSNKILKIALLIVLLLMTLPIMGIPISGILAFSGGSAFIIGIAVQPIVTNYFGGLLIYSEKFFEVGDWIYSPNQDIEGTVEYIGWRSTCIRTFDKRPMYVPNSVFSKVSVINASRMTNRRIKETIRLRYEDALELNIITEQIENMLIENEDIDNDQTLMVHFTEFGPSSLNLNIYTFTKTKNWKEYRDIQQKVFIEIIKILKNNNAKLAVSEQRIEFKNDIIKEKI